jgi:hypothetical protein
VFEHAMVSARTTRRVALAAAVAVAGLGAAAPKAAALPHGPCPPAGADVVERGRVAVVYEVARRYRACLRPSRRHRPLVPTYFAERDAFVLAGRFVAFDVEGPCADSCRRVRVVDLRSGRSVEGMPEFAVEPPPPLRALALDARGRAAYLRAGADGQLRAIDRRGDELLAAGDAVEPASVRIAGSAVHWTSAGEPRSWRLDVRRPCGRSGSATIARNDEARVYRYGDLTWGCHAATGARSALGTAFADTWEYYGGAHVHLAGRYASIDVGYGGRGGARADLLVHDLATGAVVHRWSCCSGGGASVVRVALAATGAVAWTVGGWGDRGPAGGAELRKSDADGEAIVLDSGRELDVDSLALSGTTISWRHGEERRAAELR